MSHRSGRSTGAAVVVAAFLCVAGLMLWRMSRVGPSEGGPTTRTDDLATLLAEPPMERGDGIAVALLVDTSGSMSENVKDAAGKPRAKLEIARVALERVVEQCKKFAAEQPGRPLKLAIYEFSSRSGSHARPVTPFEAPDPGKVKAAAGKLRADGGTPIGEAMVMAKRELDRAGLVKRHLLVVTDGNNTDGIAPERVMEEIAKLPEEKRPGVYFIAFDIAAREFDAVKAKGALVLSAANEKELLETLETLIGEKVLLEK